MSEARAGHERRRWIYDHVGRITGTVLVVFGLAFIAFLAAIGYRPAFGLLVVLVVGIALIALGARVKGG